eukprot:SAG31_NODE_1828_length_7159_cov_58.418980_5_plen_704_part_00
MQAGSVEPLQRVPRSLVLERPARDGRTSGNPLLPVPPHLQPRKLQLLRGGRRGGTASWRRGGRRKIADCAIDVVLSLERAYFRSRNTPPVRYRRPVAPEFKFLRKRYYKIYISPSHLLRPKNHQTGPTSSYQPSLSCKPYVGTVLVPAVGVACGVASASVSTPCVRPDRVPVGRPTQVVMSPPPLTVMTMTLLAAAVHVQGAAEHCQAPVDVARAAQQLCSSAPVADSLRSVGLLDDDVKEAAAASLRLQLEAHGMRTALDLRLLDPKGLESSELMEELRQGGASIGDRSKVRLLLGAEAPAADDCGGSTAASGSQTPTPPTANADLGSAWRRQLQEASGSGGGMSADTIAILLSVLVGAAGYLVQVSCRQQPLAGVFGMAHTLTPWHVCSPLDVQAYTARRAERSLAEQTQEQHARELAREREHEQMVAQIARTDRAVDDCCRPIQAVLEGLSKCRYQFVGGAVVELETVAPEAVTRMLEQSQKMGFAVNEKGQAVSMRSGRVLRDPAKRRDGILRMHENNNEAFDTAASMVIATSNAYGYYAEPFCSEIPTVILDYLTADPTALLARRFRLYVRHSLLPSLQRVQGLMDVHGAVVESPPTAWMSLKFPEGYWNTNPTRYYREFWYATTHAWEALVAEWESGDVSAFRPHGSAAFMPFAGVKAINDWAIARGEQRQRELIGYGRFSLIIMYCGVSLRIKILA